MTDQSSRPSPDPIGDFQRWLIRSGARSVTREVSGQLRSVLGRADEPGDVWDRATKPPPEEAPECAWCPLCRAARALRESGPAAASQVAAAGGALTGLLQEIKSAVESALAASRAASADGQAAAAPEATIWADVTVRADVSGEDVTVQDVIVQDVTVQDVTAQDVTVREARLQDAADETGPAEPPGEPAEAPAGPAEAAAGPAEEPGPSAAAGGPPDEPDDRG